MPDTTPVSSPARRLTFVAAAVALTLAVIALGGELIARTQPPVDLAALTHAGSSVHPMRTWAYVHPYAAYVNRPGVDLKFKKSVNRYGFVSTPQIDSVAKPPGRLRVAFLGGSSTAGTGTVLGDLDTWPYQTFMRLKERFPDHDIEMLNAAAGGYTSFDSYGRLWSQVRFFEPDIIVVYHGWNEMYYFDDADPEKVMNRRFKGDGDWGFPPVHVPPALTASAWDKPLGRSALYALLRSRAAHTPAALEAGEVGGERKPDAELADTFDARGVAIFKQNLLLMRGVAELVGAELFVTKQATLIVPDLPPQIRRERVFTWRHAFNYDTHLRAWQAIYEMIDATFPPERVIDATSLSGNTELLFDHIHPTPAGTRALADVVANALAQHSRKFRRP